MSPSLIYLFAAFAVVWVALFAYVMYISNRIGALQQQVDQLLEERDEQSPAGDKDRTPAKRH